LPEFVIQCWLTKPRIGDSVVSKIRPPWLISAMMFCFIGFPSSCLAREVNFKFATLLSPSKIENGFLIIWRNTGMPGDPNPSDADPDAKIEIFDEEARELAVCRVFAAIKAADPSATGTSIYDVSARKPGFIAVAAVYPRASGNPIAVLLYFDWNGSLWRRTVLNDRPEILSLEIGGAGQVWALNDFDPENPSKFVFTEFDRNGSVIKEAVRTRRKWSTDESMDKGGQTSFGIIAGKIWAWLPKTKTFVLFDDDSDRVVVKHTGLPQSDRSSSGSSSPLYARRTALLPNDRLLMDIGAVPRTPTAQMRARTGWFIWSERSGWQKVQNPVNSRLDILYAVEGDEVIFASFEKPPRERLVFQSEAIGDLTADASVRR
jgi:hypothetical protein